MSRDGRCSTLVWWIKSVNALHIAQNIKKQKRVASKRLHGHLTNHLIENKVT
jgi:hypothetical protein